jgi:hypothetical protein
VTHSEHLVGSDETTALAPQVCAPGGDHHIVGYGGLLRLTSVIRQYNLLSR